MSRYPRAARVNAGMSSDRIRACSASSVIEGAAHDKTKDVVASPACSDPPAAKISFTCSGRYKNTRLSAYGAPARRTRRRSSDASLAGNHSKPQVQHALCR